MTIVCRGASTVDSVTSTFTKWSASTPAQRWLPRVLLGLIIGGAALFLTTSLQSKTAPRSSYVAVLRAGIAYQRAGAYDLAIAEYKRAHQLAPRNPAPLFDLGDVAQFRGQSTVAARYYHACLALQPNYINALYNLAILETTTHPTTALALYTTATQQPLTAANRTLIAESYFNRGFLFNKRGQRRQGAADIARAIALDPALRQRVPQ